MLLQQSSPSSHKPLGENRRRQSSLMAGLKLLTQTNISQAEYSSMVVSKKPIFYFSMESIRTKTKAQPCYNLLSTCNLCGRKLRLGKDVYMYKGDEGFCSVECRSRQMDLDGMREIEASTTRQALVSTTRHCHQTHKSTTNQMLHDSPITHHKFVL